MAELKYTRILSSQMGCLVVEVRGLEPLPVLVGTRPARLLPPTLETVSESCFPRTHSLAVSFLRRLRLPPFYPSSVR